MFLFLSRVFQQVPEAQLPRTPGPDRGPTILTQGQKQGPGQNCRDAKERSAAAAGTTPTTTTTPTLQLEGSMPLYIFSQGKSINNWITIL